MIARVINCADCGALVVARSNARKYCVSCAKERERERQREHWRTQSLDPAFRQGRRERHARRWATDAAYREGRREHYRDAEVRVRSHERYVVRWATDAAFRERKREHDQERIAEHSAIFKRLALTWRQAAKLGGAEVVAAYKRAMQPDRIERALREALGIPPATKERV